MDLNEFQRKALRTFKPILNENEQLVECALGLTGESGEFADAVKKWRFHGHDMDRANLLIELGDIMFYAAVTASVLGADLNEVARMNNEKLEKRYPDGFDVDRSRNRDEYELDA